MIKSKKQMYLVIGAFALVLLLGTTTYAFFNYTRTGASNVIKTGRIYFNSTQDGNINLTNVFPITSRDAETDTTNTDEVVITITGDTTYTSGIEYLVTLEDVNIETSTNKKIPISIIVTPEADDTELGTANDNYFNTGVRGGNTSYYKVLADDTVKDGEYVLVGYIRPGQAEVNGKIGIKAYLDASKILISDTYDGTESDNMGTLNSMAEGKTVLTTTEWNSIQGNNAISFKVRVQSNEGIWVGEPLSRNDMVNINTANLLTSEQKSSITEVNFIRMSEEMINAHTDLIDLTADGGQGVVKAWIDGTKLYIASPGETYFPVDSTALFKNYSSVTTINFNNVNTSEVENMTALFWDDSSLAYIDLNSFDTANVVSMLSMFRGCSSLVSLDLSMLDSSSVVNMNNLVQNCSNLAYINISGLGSNNLTSAYTMFDGAAMLKTIVMSKFNFGSFTNLNVLFNGNNILNVERVDLNNSIVPNLTNMSYMFSSRVNLISVDLSGINIDSVQSMYAMFNGCSNLSTIYVSNTWNVNNVTSPNDMFSGCTSLVGGAGTTYDANHIDKEYARVDGGPSNPGYLTLKAN